MTVFAYGSAPTPPPTVSPVEWGRLTSTWVGYEGSLWELSDWGRGVFHSLADMIGLHNPGWEPQTRRRRRGQRVPSYSTLPRDVEWPIHLYSEDGSQGWAELDAAFWRSFHPLKTGVWTVTSPSGASRSIALRLEDDGQVPFGRDPYFTGWVNYQVSLVADDPLWRGKTVRETWSQKEQLPHRAATGAPPFNISSSKQLAGAKVTNGGDEDAWSTWTVTSRGGEASAEITVAGGMFQIPRVPDGMTAVVSTDEEKPVGHLGRLEPHPTEKNQTIFVPEDEITGELAPWDPRPIPPGRDVPIGFEVQGFADVTAEFTELHWRGLPV